MTNTQKMLTLRDISYVRLAVFPMTRKKRLHDAISSALLPVFLKIEDESNNHRRPGVETHFRVVIVSHKFDQKSRVERHRFVNTLANNEFKAGLHALSLHLHTPAEWEERKQSAPASPNCQHAKNKT
ncbi:MAG: BolA family transcriptional regulator [Legionellaceae bacterium]|nr:BolA family transcriptional regulator [Legionellaceae bacterium]